jgi:hypothetical protein
VLVLAAVVVAVIRRRRVVDLAVLVFLTLIVVTLLGGLHWTDFTLSQQGSPFIQGRYLLPLATLAGLGVATALTLLKPRGRSAAIGVVLGGLLTLQLLSLGTTLMRFYA